MNNEDNRIMKDIVIISEFCDDFSKSDNNRFFYLAKMLTSSLYDNKVEIVTSSFHHTTKKHRRGLTKKYTFKITFIDEPGYPKNICLKRFQSHYVWGKNIQKYLRSREKPDVVYCAVPSLTGPNLVARHCKQNNIRFIVDIQDLWPEAFQMILNVPVVSKIGFAPFFALANGIYKRADSVCGVSETYVDRALKANQKCRKGTVVYLGTELGVFDRYAAKNPILVKGEEEVWLGYCGTLGASYDLTCVIDALAILDSPKIKFVIMGDGPNMNEFKKYAAQKGIEATFTGRLPYDKMCSLLSICDIAVNPIAHMSAASIINKHADYAAAGIPVVNTQENDEYRVLVHEYQMGFNCKNNDPGDLAKKIRILASSPKLRKKMGLNSRKCAVEKFDRGHTYDALVREIIR